MNKNIFSDSNNRSNEGLLFSSLEGDTSALDYVLEEGSILSERNVYKSQLLMLAAFNGDISRIEFLLKNGASLDAKNTYGSSALLMAAFNGHTSTLAYLLEKGSSLDEKNENGDTALMLAALNGHISSVVYLLKKGASVDKKNKNGYTALLFSALNGHIPVLGYLLSQGASLSEKNNYGHTALLLAARNGHRFTLEYLLQQGSSLAEKNNEGYTALLVAAFNGHTAILEYLLERGVSLKGKNNKGNTALLLAARNGHISTLSYLIKRGSSLNEKNNEGNTALLIAARNGHTSIVDYLLQEGASLFDENDYGNTALILAVYYGKTETVSTLLRYDFDLITLNQAGILGLTPLSLAKVKKYQDIMNLLEEAPQRDDYYDDALRILKENGGIHTMDAFRCLHIAETLGHKKAYYIINEFQFQRALLLQLAQKDKWDEFYHQMCMLGTVNEMTCLFEDERFIFLSTIIDKESGNTLLHYAASQGQIKAVRLLLNFGVINTHAINHQGFSPFQLAQKNGYNEISLLISGYIRFYANYPSTASCFVHPDNLFCKDLRISHFSDAFIEFIFSFSYLLVLYPNCRNLIFEKKDLSNRYIEEIFRILKEKGYAQQLINLGFTQCQITDNLLEKIVVNLLDFPQIACLNLSKNILSSKSIHNIQYLIQYAESLSFFDLRENYFGNKCLKRWIDAIHKREKSVTLLLQGNYIHDKGLAELENKISSYPKIYVAGNPIVGYKIKYLPLKKESQLAREAFQSKYGSIGIIFEPSTTYQPLSIFRFLSEEKRQVRVFNTHWHVGLCIKRSLRNNLFLMIEGVFKNGQYFLFQGKIRLSEDEWYIKCDYIHNKYRFEKHIRKKKYNIHMFPSIPKRVAKTLKLSIQSRCQKKEPIHYPKWIKRDNEILNHSEVEYFQCFSWWVLQLEEHHIVSKEEKERRGLIRFI